MSLKSFLSDILRRLGSQSELNNLFDFQESLSRWQQRLNDDFFRIAVVGEFSSGKSTFINALVGRDILSHATSETTAALSRLVNVSPDDERNGHGRAYMKDDSTIEIENLADIKEFTTTQSTKYKVAEEVDHVEVYVPILQANQSVVIVDTPGLNGMAEGHLEQTIKMVQEAHACIYILQRRGLTNNDIKFLKEYLIPYQRNFIFVQNFLDEFNASEGETIEQRVSAATDILNANVFNDVGQNQYFFEVCCVSALRELAGRDDSIKRLYSDSIEDLTPENREQLLNTSGFGELRKILEDNFNQSELEKIKFAGMLKLLINWCEKLIKRIENRQQEVDEMYRLSSEYKANQNWDSLRDKITRSKAGDKEALNGFVSRQCSELEKIVQKELYSKLNAIVDRIKQKLNDCKDIEELRDYSNNLNSNIKSKIYKSQEQLNEYCNLKLKEIYQLIKERIEEYSGIRQTNLSTPNLEIKPPEKSQDFVPTDTIDRYRRNLNEKIAERDRQSRELSSNNYSISRAQSDVRDWENSIQRANGERYRLGSRPQTRVWEEEEEYYRDRTGFFGGFRTSLFGQKKDTRTVTKTDDSAGQEWDRKKQEIENRIDYLRRQKNAAERRLNQLRSEAAENQQRIDSAEYKIKSLEADLRLEEDRVKTAERLAKEKYLKTTKSAMRNEIDYYFHNSSTGIIETLSRQWSDSIDSAKRDLQARAARHFEESYNQKLRDIEHSKSLTDTQLQQQVKDVQKTKFELGNILVDLKQKAREIE